MSYIHYKPSFEKKWCVILDRGFTTTDLLQTTCPYCRNNIISYFERSKTKARAGGNRRSEKSEQIIQELKDMASITGYLPRRALTNLAVKYNVGRERIRQLAFIGKVPGYREYIQSFKRACTYCAEATLCSMEQNRNKNFFCSDYCKNQFFFYSYHWLMKCEECGEYSIQEEKHTDEKHKRRRYCDKHCFGRWMGKAYGFKKGESWKVRGRKEVVNTVPDVPLEFTVADLKARYNLSSSAGWARIRRLKQHNLIENVGKRGRLVVYGIVGEASIRMSINREKPGSRIHHAKYSYTPEFLWSKFHKKWITKRDYEKVFGFRKHRGGDGFAKFVKLGALTPVMQNGIERIYRINYEGR